MTAKCKTHMISDYTLGYSRYSYETTDTVEDIERPGYFDPAAAILRPRDLLDVWANVGADPVFRTYAVAMVDGETASVEVRRLEDVGGGSAAAKPLAARKALPVSGAKSRRRA